MELPDIRKKGEKGKNRVTFEARAERPIWREYTKDIKDGAFHKSEILVNRQCRGEEGRVDITHQKCGSLRTK